MKTEEFDYVIVGAGSAGCTLAYRLGENPALRILVLEAGGEDRSSVIKTPLLWGLILKNRLFDWGYFSEPEGAMDIRVELAEINAQSRFLMLHPKVEQNKKFPVPTGQEQYRSGVNDGSSLPCCCHSGQTDPCDHNRPLCSDVRWLTDCPVIHARCDLADATTYSKYGKSV